jgi:hypothetical protein
MRYHTLHICPKIYTFKNKLNQDCLLSSKVGNNATGSGETEENCFGDTGICFAVLSSGKTRAVWLFVQWFWITEV